MQCVEGIWLPDGDVHFAEALPTQPKIAGKATYQLKKYLRAMPFVPHKHVALDIGAHVGLWSRVMSFEFDIVYAYEPGFFNYKCALMNTDDLPNVTVRKYALGDREGAVDIARASRNSGNTAIAQRNEHGDEFAPMVIGDKLAHCVVGPVNFIKIDVEGYELPVVQGLRQTIVDHKPIVVIEQKPGNAERYGWDRFAAKKFLEGLGMRERWEIAGDYLMTWGD